VVIRDKDSKHAHSFTSDGHCRRGLWRPQLYYFI
jgi:hypothetical protein